jgi:hypothetical protein
VKGARHEGMWGLEILLCAFLTSARYGGEWSTSRCVLFTFGERARDIELRPARDPELVLTLHSSEIETQIQSLHIWQYLGAFAKLSRMTISFVMSVRLCVRPSFRVDQLGSHWKHIYEIWYLKIFRRSVDKIQISLQSEKNKGHFTWRPTCNFLNTSRSFLLRMRNVSDKSCRENQNTHFEFSNFFFNPAAYEIMWKDIVEWGRPQMTIWRTRIAFLVPKTTNTHTVCVILIAFPLQQSLQERASMLRLSTMPVWCK